MLLTAVRRPGGCAARCLVTPPQPSHGGGHPPGFCRHDQLQPHAGSRVHDVVLSLARHGLLSGFFVINGHGATSPLPGAFGEALRHGPRTVWRGSRLRWKLATGFLADR